MDIDNPVTNKEDLMEKFATVPVTKENVAQYYGGVDVAVYDDFVQMINFTDPLIMAQIIAFPSAGGNGYGQLNLPLDAAIFDLATGTGFVGKALAAKGYKNVEGGDATAQYV